jgi:hypothetical protein
MIRTDKAYYIQAAKKSNNMPTGLRVTHIIKKIMGRAAVISLLVGWTGILICNAHSTTTKEPTGEYWYVNANGTLRHNYGADKEWVKTMPGIQYRVETIRHYNSEKWEDRAGICLIFAVMWFPCLIVWGALQERLDKRGGA